MAERDRWNQRSDERGGAREPQGRAGALRGGEEVRRDIQRDPQRDLLRDPQRDPQRDPRRDLQRTGGAESGRSEFGSYGGSGYGGYASGSGSGSGGYSSGYGGVGGSRAGGPGGYGGYGGPGGGDRDIGAIGGAAGVRNRGPKGWQRSDDRIHDDVCERLSAEHGIDPSDVTVTVSGGNVTLNGTVPDRGMKYRIEDIVDACSGVRDVDNRLRVSRGGMGGMLGGAAMGMGTTTDARSGRAAEQGSRGSLLGRLFGFSSGTRLSDVMTRDPRTVSPDEPLDKVARLMKELDIGAIPVCSDRKLQGMVTDRDIVVRGLASGKPLDGLKASEVMTTQVHSCYEDDDVESALDKMGNLQVRRIPVLDHTDQLVGIVSLGDFAQRDTGDVEEALQDISKPG